MIKERRYQSGGSIVDADLFERVDCDDVNKGREDIPSLFLSRGPRGGAAASIILLALIAAQALMAATICAAAEQSSAGPSPSLLRTAQATTPADEDKSKGEKSSVPATVVDGEQLESVLGIEAASATGEDMGRIVDIVVDRTGQVRAAIIDFGGFLGVGSRKIAVDWRSLHFDPKKAGAVVVNLTKDQLRVAPVYKAGEPVVVIGGPSAKP
jgi:hypothetical protein